MHFHLSQIIKKTDKNYPNIKIDVDSNLVTLEIPKIEKNNFINNYYYSTITVFTLEKGKKLSFYDKYDIDVQNYYDLKLFTRLKSKFYNKEGVLEICKKIHNNDFRSFIYNIINELNINENIVFKFDLFSTYIKHSLIVSKPVNFENHNFLYIGAGDTIFHSHFITGSGLNRTINFAVKCANFITNLSLIND